MAGDKELVHVWSKSIHSQITPVAPTPISTLALDWARCKRVLHKPKLRGHVEDNITNNARKKRILLERGAIHEMAHKVYGWVKGEKYC